jgi:hypothetical protein
MDNRGGTSFLRILDSKSQLRGNWDPFLYRADAGFQTLGDFIKLERLRAHQRSILTSPFDAVEYRSIPSGSYLSFDLRRLKGEEGLNWPRVGELQLLFGTMRAYLGNVLVTPRAEWIGLESPMVFSVKSEFIRVIPNDSFVFFWLAYLRSDDFLRNLPIGTGGTRPRLNDEAFLNTPVCVPEKKERSNMNRILLEHAAEEWKLLSTRLKSLHKISG